jgi:spore maturation protein CgeB
MKIVLFYHSLLSDWNHGNAHFLRGIMGELVLRGHDVDLYEPANSWSVQNLRAEYGDKPITRFYQAYPTLSSQTYDLATLNLDVALAGADLVIVHEWSDHDLVRRIGEHHASHPGYRLLFHDTHHRALTAPEEMRRYDLSHYNGVLAYGRVLRDLYLQRRWTERAWTWHEAADTRVFRPIATEFKEGELVWVGNWGDDERTAELHEFLLGPVKDLKLRARIYGVRYPDHARAALADAGIQYAGWLPNFDAPHVFSRFKVTVHVPRRPYVRALRGIPTIRPFEALACGIPLVSSPWEDCEHLFTPDEDYLIASSGDEMKHHLRFLLDNPQAARRLAAHGHRTLLSRHTCAHRVDELMEIVAELSSASKVLRPRPRSASKLKRAIHSSLNAEPQTLNP